MEAAWDDLSEPCVLRYHKWDKDKTRPYNALAWHKRNEAMAEIADGAVVIWDGRSNGAKNMIKLAKEYELPNFIVRTG